MNATVVAIKLGLGGLLLVAVAGCLAPGGIPGHFSRPSTNRNHCRRGS